MNRVGSGTLAIAFAGLVVLSGSVLSGSVLSCSALIDPDRDALKVEAGAGTGGGAASGAPGTCDPNTCDDNNACTIDGCGDDGQCQHVAPDEDGDGFTAARREGATCDGDDCNDASDRIFPNASEACDGEDNDCDGAIDDNCLGDTCGAPYEVVLAPADDPETLIAEVAGNFSFFSNSTSFCDEEAAPDAIFAVTNTGGPARLTVEQDSSADASVPLAISATRSIEPDCGKWRGCAASDPVERFQRFIASNATIYVVVAPQRSEDAEGPFRAVFSLRRLESPSAAVFSRYPSRVAGARMLHPMLVNWKPCCSSTAS